jgi:hypothetical protein
VDFCICRGEQLPGELGVGPERKTGARRREVCQKDFSPEKYLLVEEYKTTKI